MRARFFKRLVGAALLVCLIASRGGADDAHVIELRSKYDALLRETLSGKDQSLRPAAPASGSVVFVAADEYTPAAAKSSQAADPKYADALFELAIQAADAGQCSLAFQWATEVLRANPDHAEARRVMGYVERDRKWLTAYG